VSCLSISIIFRAQDDGTVSGTYFFSSGGFIYEGVLTDGTTDGNTYTLSGEGLGVCGAGSPPVSNILPCSNWPILFAES
jgi:hypothetical protein